MNATRITLAVAFLSVAFSPNAFAAPACSANVKVPATARIFAKADDESAWTRYSQFDQLPELQRESGMYALYWLPKKKRPSVYIVQLAQGFYLQTRYCFDSKGRLEDVDFEIGTSLGWGHREQGPILSGGFDANRVEFFNTTDGKPIGTPFGAGRVPRALQPKLYLSVSDLPFASLLGLPQGSVRK